MRYYLLSSEGDEIVIDLTNTRVHSSELVEFEYTTKEGTELTNRKTVFVRQLAGQYFVSFDGTCWDQIPKEVVPEKILNINQTYDLYRGYKPSGVGGVESGDLVTQMPGLVVKIPVKVGQEVKKGDTMVILEAMKMENEIKCAIDGTVKDIHVKEGESLEQGRLMMELEAS